MISAILLASGLSVRMGRDKLLLEFQGKSFLQRAVDLMLDLPVFERIIITSEVRAKKIALPSGVQIILNTKPENGISESIRIGTMAASGTHYIFFNADQPKLTAADITPILEASKANPDKIIFPVIDSGPGSPTIFPASFKKELINLSGDNGGRIIRDKHRDYCMAIRPDNHTNFEDIDKEEEFRDLF